MSEMVERVAAAMYLHGPSTLVIPSGWPFPEWEEADQSIKDCWRDYARILIAAMREPTEAMVVAAGKENELAATPEADATAAWQTMIDEALK